jgi:hypothetical protein
MLKETRGYKEVRFMGFFNFSEKWNKYYCPKCKTYFKKPRAELNRPNECCKTEAFDDGYDYFCPKCNHFKFEYPIEVATRIWNKERPNDTV